MSIKKSEYIPWRNMSQNLPNKFVPGTQQVNRQNSVQNCKYLSNNTIKHFIYLDFYI